MVLPGKPSAIRIAVASLTLSAAGMVGIAGWEQYQGVAYVPTKDDVPTLGWGETKGVKRGDKTTPDRALAQLLVSSAAHADGVRGCVKVPLTQYEFDAYVSLTYNIGVSGFCNSTLVKKLNALDYAGACQEILRWDRQAGKPLAGLTRRRQVEYRQCTGQT
jgi:lysozyme